MSYKHKTFGVLLSKSVITLQSLHFTGMENDGESQQTQT